MRPLVGCDGRPLRDFPPTRLALADPPGLLCLGGDLGPERLLAGYRRGIFPWFSEGEPVLWWSPPERGVFDLSRFGPSPRMRRWLRRCDWTVQADRDFPEVMRECGRERDDGGRGWIFEGMVAAYARLHALGYAHSLEVHDAAGQRIGGVYGVSLGSAFFAESMYSRRSNASKVALYALADWLRRHDIPCFDAQLPNPHLLSLGMSVWPRAAFEAVLATLVDRPAGWPAGTWNSAFGTLRADALAGAGSCDDNGPDPAWTPPTRRF